MKTEGWTKSEIHEALVTLYLRLNGYFTTGLILHSPDWGENRTELDCLAVRHPNHHQPDRGLEASEFLSQGRNEVDLLFCEVKSLPTELVFNKPLQTDVEAVRAILRWAGVFREDEVVAVAERLQPLLKEGVTIDTARNGIVENGCRVRALLCCPSCSDDSCIDRWCLVNSEIFGFIAKCFVPSEPRGACSTRYNFRQWGYAMSPLVQYFKNVPFGKAPNLADLYAHLGAR